jgi:hypothetical protein
MPVENRTFSRRDFIKAAGAAGLGSALGPLYPLDSAHAGAPTNVPEQRVVPTRPFGKTGVDVSSLSLGGVLKDTDQIVFRQAFKSGVTYWDTADSYGWGNNEKAIGSYFARFPGDREKVFRVTMAAGSNAQELSDKLGTSLQRMNTPYVDMYLSSTMRILRFWKASQTYLQSR